MHSDREVAYLAVEVLRLNRKLEHFMSQTDDAIAQIASAVGKVATDVQTLTDEVNASGDTATAAKLQPILDQLNALDALTPDPAAPPVEPLPDGPPTA